MSSAEIIGVERIGQPGLGWLPLKSQGMLANTAEDISRNIEHSLGLDYIPFNDLIGKSKGAVAVVGSGPSLKTNWQELKKFNGEIIACNAACQFLLEKVFTPHKEITYLLASRVVPQACEILKGCKIVIWHAAGDDNIQAILEKKQRNEPMVVGGSAAVTRALILAMPMGYTEIHVYGGDSSFAKGDTHIRQSTTVEKRMAIKCNGRVFECAPWMTLQVEDLKKMVGLIKFCGTKMFFHGDGLLQRVASELGFRTDYESAFMQMLRLAVSFCTVRAKVLWLNL